jgi:hypothetical protein
MERLLPSRTEPVQNRSLVWGAAAGRAPHGRKPEKALDSGATFSRLGVSMAHMLNAGKSVVFAFAAHIRMR